VARGGEEAAAQLVVTAPVVRAAGGVVTRQGDDGSTEVLVVHRPRYDDWSFPKGKADGDEPDEETARREVEEETGCRCRLVQELGLRRYTDRRGRPKQVRYWQMTVEDEQPFRPNHEVDALRWLSPEQAATLLTYEGDRRLLDILGTPR
jgi:8-oxo-dGTP pyrophosphatase MutT (NUDIX family)